MNIQKDDITYSVRETKADWRLFRTIGKITIEYAIPKETCRTFDELNAYVLSLPALGERAKHEVHS